MAETRSKPNEATDQAPSGPKHRLEALRKREASLKAAIADELERDRRRTARLRDRLVAIVGTVLLDEADRSANFKLMLQQTLNTAVVDAKSRRLLSNLGYL
jgi:hypothetical protein